MVNPIDTAPKRERLRPRKSPYWHRLLPKRFLGYRKSVFGGGTWIAKYEEHGQNPRREKVLGHESELQTFESAESAARDWFRELDAENRNEDRALVRDACSAYVDALRSQGRFKTGDYELDGHLYQVQLYHRALTAAEISQNFQALRGRYGL